MNKISHEIEQNKFLLQLRQTEWFLTNNSVVLDTACNNHIIITSSYVAKVAQTLYTKPSHTDTLYKALAHIHCIQSLVTQTLYAKFSHTNHRNTEL
jgi:hypothetical protein